MLYTGDGQLASEAVADVMVGAANDPAITTADPVRVWSLLASRFRVPNEQAVVRGSTAARVRMAGLSVAQRETMALIVAGRAPGDVAALLQIPNAQVHDDFCAGAGALDAAMSTVPASPDRSMFPW